MSSDEDFAQLFESSSSSSSDDEVGLTQSEFIQRAEYIAMIREQFLATLPEEPQDDIPKFIFFFYYSVQFVIAFAKSNGEKPIPDPYMDSDEVSIEKAYLSYIGEIYPKFMLIINAIADSFYNLVYDKLEDHIGAKASKDHPLIYFLSAVEKHKEMHCRHLKTDPGVARSRSDDVQETLNAVTGERYDFENIDHKTWRSLIINPLPSDYNNEDIDPAEGGHDHIIAIELLKEAGKYTIPEPFSIVVTQEWEHIFRTVHTLIHFEDYLFTKILGCIPDSEWDLIEKMTFKETWTHLMSEEFAETPVTKLSGGKKKIPPLVSAMIELREMLKRIIVLGN